MTIQDLINNGLIKGTKINLEKLETLKKRRWTRLDNDLYQCQTHKTLFDYDEYEYEPCWQCYNECEEDA